MYETPEKDNSCKHIPGRLVFNRISARSHKVDVVQVIQTNVHENEWAILVVQSVGMFPKGSTEKRAFLCSGKPGMWVTVMILILT